MSAPSELEQRGGEIVMLAVKSQDTAQAIEALASAMPATTPIVCAQNGVTNEAIAAARWQNVYGMMVWMPALHLTPGAVELYAAEPSGMLRIGLHPDGNSPLATTVAGHLRGAGFDAAAVPDISRWKHGKLLTNSGNALDAYVDSPEAHRDVFPALLAEGAACLTAAHIPFKSPTELIEEMTALTNFDRRQIRGRSRPGGSTWQSVTRGSPAESVHFNGYICELGERHGVPTPINRALLELASAGAAPRSIPLAQLLEMAKIPA